MKKNIPQVDALTSANAIYVFLEYARSLKKDNKISSDLASALIYANFAEFLASSLLLTIHININLNLNDKAYGLSVSNGRKLPSNLEYLILELEEYQFPLKEKIVPLLKKIKDQRNKLFHNLILASQKGLKPSSLVRNIQNDTERLLNLYTRSEKNAIPFKKK